MDNCSFSFLCFVCCWIGMVCWIAVIAIEDVNCALLHSSLVTFCCWGQVPPTTTSAGTIHMTDSDHSFA